MRLFKLFGKHARKLPSDGAADLGYRSTSGFTVILEDRKKITVPYRVKFSKTYAATDTTGHYCRRSRSSDGYKREAALKKLIMHRLTPQETAYLLVALGDYVIEVSTIPLDASAQIKHELRKLVKENSSLVKYLEAVTISYWNEYYRGRYQTYAEYPPYRFLQGLKEHPTSAGNSKAGPRNYKNT